jgi:catechol 2,3-dioxygenase-like lactoylglutathione lyase family enzyme
VFFVKEAERSLAFYTETLGFTVDWNHQVEDRVFVFQVSLFGFQLILNQVEEWTQNRAGHGRVFVGLDGEQAGALLRHISEKGIQATIFHWGAPTLVLRDLDQNELFFWLPQEERDSIEAKLQDGRDAASSATRGLTSRPNEPRLP